MTQVAIILTPDELQSIVRAEVKRQLETVQAAQALPLRMNCKEAAKCLGVSDSTFHSRYSHLKRYEGNLVFVSGADLVKYL